MLICDIVYDDSCIYVISMPLRYCFRDMRHTLIRHSIMLLLPLRHDTPCHAIICAYSPHAYFSPCFSTPFSLLLRLFSSPFSPLLQRTCADMLSCCAAMRCRAMPFHYFFFFMPSRLSTHRLLLMPMLPCVAAADAICRDGAIHFHATCRRSCCCHSAPCYYAMHVAKIWRQYCCACHP